MGALWLPKHDWEPPLTPLPWARRHYFFGDCENDNCGCEPPEVVPCSENSEDFCAEGGQPATISVTFPAGIFIAPPSAIYGDCRGLEGTYVLNIGSANCDYCFSFFYTPGFFWFHVRSFWSFNAFGNLFLSVQSVVSGVNHFTAACNTSPNERVSWKLNPGGTADYFAPVSCFATRSIPYLNTVTGSAFTPRPPAVDTSKSITVEP